MSLLNGCLNHLDFRLYVEVVDLVFAAVERAFDLVVAVRGPDLAVLPDWGLEALLALRLAVLAFAEAGLPLVAGFFAALGFLVILVLLTAGFPAGACLGFLACFGGSTRLISPPAITV